MARSGSCCLRPGPSRHRACDGAQVLGQDPPADPAIEAALAELQDRTGQQLFTVREVYAEMLAAGTSYAEPTAFKTMQRMKAPAGRAPWIILEQTGAGFRVCTQT